MTTKDERLGLDKDHPTVYKWRQQVMLGNTYLAFADWKSSEENKARAAMEPVVSNVEYTARGGGICPFCREEVSIEGRSYDPFDGELFQRIDCNECGASWTDHYILKGYIDPKV